MSPMLNGIQSQLTNLEMDEVNLDHRQQINDMQQEARTQQPSMTQTRSQNDIVQVNNILKQKQAPVNQSRNAASNPRARRSAQSSGQINEYVNQPRKLRLKSNIQLGGAGQSQRGYGDEMRMYNEMEMFGGNQRQKRGTRNTFKEHTTTKRNTVMLPSRFERTDMGPDEMEQYQTFNDAESKSTHSNPRTGPSDYNK